MKIDSQEKKRLNVFGYGLAVILGLFALRLWFKDGWVFQHIFYVTAMTTILVLTISCPAFLKPFYRQWMQVAHMIGTLLTQILLTVIFYGLFTPIGIVLRILRKDLLDRPIETHKSSYWILKEGQSDKNRYKQQF